MVQAKAKKHPKPKSKKQPPPPGKKNGKPGDIAQFSSQLDALGLKIVPLVADGNCFFRGVADQLEGNEEEHAKYRHMVVEYIMKHREEFEPFIEDDVPFDEYCQSMEKDGTWAGHMEIQAASLVCRSNICIHRSMSPRWYIKNFPDPGNRMIHLSYHDGEHYNSVRLKEDPCDGPAEPIIIEADAVLSASNQAKVSVKKAKAANSEWTTVDPSSIKIVMGGSGCEDPKRVEQVLREVHGNVDAAIEFLVAEGACEATTQIDATTCASYSQDVTIEQSDKFDQSASCESSRIADSIPSEGGRMDESVLHKEEKKTPRNKVCPCGSRKKYKACCGAASGRLSARIELNRKVVTNRMRKEQTRQGKAELHSGVLSQGSDSGQLDLGALCI